jgi:hypothetical protein
MFKGKNKVTKISNTIFLIFVMLASLSLLSMFLNAPKDVAKVDLHSNMILMGIYVVFSVIILWITNKKIDLYKDEYSVSRQVFNLFLLVSIMSAILMLGVNVLSYVFYKKFSWYSLILELFCFIPIYLIAYMEVSKDKLLNINNSKKVNICNLVIIILLMNYSSIVLSSLLQMLFNSVDVIIAIKNICISLIWIAIVLIAHKLINKDV